MGNAMRVLITGGAGFIGRRTAKVLADHGFAVTILDNRIAAREHLLGALAHQASCVEGDTKDERLVFDLVRNKDVVIHLAAGCSFLMYEKRPVAETVNVVQGFLNILEAVRAHRVRKLIYASTSAVYEGNSLPYREDMSLSPPDLKALAKKVIEELAQLYSSPRYGVKTLGLRPFSVYGDGEIDKKGYANVTSLFAWAMLRGMQPIVWGNGTQTRDFIFVDDLAEIIHKCVIQDFEERVVNAGTGVETSFNEIVRMINEHLFKPLEPDYEEKVPISVYAPRLRADTTRQRRLGLDTRTDIRTGIAKIVESFKSLPDSIQAELAGAQEENTPGRGIKSTKGQ